MKRKDAFGMISILFLASVLFMPSDSKLWAYILALGVVFGVLWLIKE